MLRTSVSSNICLWKWTSSETKQEDTNESSDWSAFSLFFCENIYKQMFCLKDCFEISVMLQYFHKDNITEWFHFVHLHMVPPQNVKMCKHIEYEKVCLGILMFWRLLSSMCVTGNTLHFLKFHHLQSWSVYSANSGISSTSKYTILTRTTIKMPHGFIQT